MYRSLHPIAGVIVCLTVFVGCNGPSEIPARQAAATITTTAPTTVPAAGDPVVASISGSAGGHFIVYQSELDAQLYQAYGLQFLFDVVEFDLAKSTLAHEGMTLQQADIDRERQLIFKKLTENSPSADPADYDKYLDQLLERQHLTRAEFDIRAVKIGACLRKIVEPSTINSLPDSAVRKGFSQMYGEKRQIADIQVPDLKSVGLVKARLAEGAPFEQVARDMSTDNVTAPMGGAWQFPFSSQSPANVVAASIKEAAFAMDKEEQISDSLNDGKSYHVIKLLKIIPPAIMKYEDVKADVRKALEDKLIDIKMKTLREELTQLAQQQIEIDQPALRDQWNKIIEAHAPKAADRDKVSQQMDKSHQQSLTAPGDRPPATMPGAIVPGK